jgi:hypothetical protein
MRRFLGRHRVLRAGLPIIRLRRPEFEVLRGKVSIRLVEEYTTTCSFVEMKAQIATTQAFGRIERLNAGREEGASNGVIHCWSVRSRRRIYVEIRTGESLNGKLLGEVKEPGRDKNLIDPWVERIKTNQNPL